MAKLLSVRLREKTDRNGKKYLFGAIPELNCVAFVYDDTKPGDTEKSFEFCVKPYGQLAVVAADAPAGSQRLVTIFVNPEDKTFLDDELGPPARVAR